MPSGLKKLDHVMDKLEENIVGIATLLMVLIIFINVVLRNFASTSLSWGNEASSYLNIIAVYLAVGAGFKFGDHVGVSVFVDYVFPKKWRKGLDVITELVNLAFCGMCVVFAIRMMMLQAQMGQVSAVLRMPLWIIYGVIMVGMIFACVRIIMNIVRIVKNDKLSAGSEIEEEVDEIEQDAVEEEMKEENVIAEEEKKTGGDA